MAVIKGNAYGHGMSEVANALAPHADAFAVATIDEALSLRDISSLPIVVMQGVYRLEQLVEASQRQLTIMVHHPDQVALIKETPLHQPINLWLKVDSGMHRLGLSHQQCLAAVEQLSTVPWIKSKPVICSHLANASDPAHPENEQQWQLFNTLMETLGPDFEYSLANSPALLSNSRYCLDWNRPGIMLYGGAPFDDIHHPLAAELQPAMYLTSEVIAIREIAKGETVGYGSTWTATRPSTIATLAIGYADGYPRLMPSGTPVAINGQRASLVGRVSMDMITVDVTDLDKVTLGDQAEMWGKIVSINEIADRLGTISYELMTSVTPRVRKVYTKAAD